MRNADLVVIGAGVIGNSIAYYSAKAGMNVVVIERRDILNGTSSACDTAIHLQSKNPGVHLEMALKSIQKYPELQKGFDLDIHFRITGTMLAIQTPAQLAVMEKFAARQKEAGLNVKVLNEAETLAIQPAMKGGRIIGSTYCDQDATIHPQNLTRAYYLAARRLGARYQLFTEIKEFRIENGRLSGLITDKEEIRCQWIVNACGAFAPLLGRRLGVDIPIAPRRGQIIVTEPVPKLTSTIVNCAKYIAAKYQPDLLGDSPADRLGVGLSLTQTERGNLLLGGTREFAGYDTKTTRQGLALVANHGAEILPALKDINIIRTFAGLRPYTPDGLPIIGESPQRKGLLIAAGHEGDGLALSAITGELVSQIAAGAPISSGIDLSRLSPERFAGLDMLNFYRKHHIFS